MTSAARPLVIGHRGASGYRPEHTAAAYRLAFRLGADAVEPDIVASKDGVLVLRHENEISGTTDVADRPEFAGRRTTKTIDGARVTGWFTEDFTWDELATLRARERLPQLRQSAASFDGTAGILRLRDLVDLMPADALMVAEIKHATYFASIGLPLEELFASEIRDWATSENLIVESFEQSVLGQIRERGIPGRFVYLLEAAGSAPDLRARFGRKALPYSAQLTNAGLARLAGEVDGISVDKKLLLRTDASGAVVGSTDLVKRAHAAGLEVYTWTLRAENRFLGKGMQRGSAARDFGDWRREFRIILDSGIDGVFADQPDLVRELLDR
ncbi:glycerophosphodiester phosphodiesterase family protein [Salinibacterium soli]|uniref:glycerophosphodiester phosphodiesterase n=1 Tax=Antiquaquibacter soli TaxID=3064523 RepID=A0ABT9BPH5_9MICO|nr:glycerophosphodiester phosphodiesterase family protein [Protaetiibacter sp. WY-16]MDO7882932.1 glycerophosphodiester phosphodiesterase family protein [Protaetiibacter sp. WY-16]